MNSILLLIILTPAYSLTASLTLLEYDPLLFQLTFSSPINRPSFQLLYNNIYDIPYSFISNTTNSDTFIFSASINDLQSTSNLQSYDLLFNSPLTVGDGTLELENYELHAQKSNIQINFPAGLSVFILICAYFFNLFTQIGKLAIEFMQVYTIYMFHNVMTSTIYRELYIGLLLIPPTDKLEAQSFDKTYYILVCLIVPMAIIFLLWTIGYLLKKLAPPAEEEQIFRKIVYEEFIFDAFVKATRIFSFNLLFNSIKFIEMSNQDYQPIKSIKSIGSLLVYFNIITLLSIIYLKLYVLNPRLGQPDESWKQYLESSSFKDFRVIHSKVHLDPWYKRNYSLFNSLRIVFIVCFFEWPGGYQYMILVIEFSHIFYIFTVRPFKEEYIINVSVICRLFFLAQYMFIVLGNLYYSIGPIAYNYYRAQSMIRARGAVFLTIIFGFFIAVIFEIYFNCSDLNYKISLVRENNQFSLKFAPKPRQQSESRDMSKTKNTKNTTITYSNFSDRRSKSSSRPFDSISDVSGIVASPGKSNKKEMEERKEEEELMVSSPGSRGISKTKAEVEIQMVQMKKRDTSKSKGKSKRERANSERKKNWDGSLLEGMMQKKE